MILFAEDDELLRTFVLEGLKQAGMPACAAADGREALDLARSRPFDLLILDRNLPRLNGIDVLRALRGAGDQTPALFLTAIGDVSERVRGLDAGADDYMSKPFALEELLARARALIRRPPATVREKLGAGPLRIDLTARRTFVNDVEIELTAQDMVLLSTFLRQPQRAFSREALLDQKYAAGDCPDRADLDAFAGTLEGMLRAA